MSYRKAYEETQDKKMPMEKNAMDPKTAPKVKKNYRNKSLAFSKHLVKQLIGHNDYLRIKSLHDQVALLLYTLGKSPAVYADLAMDLNRKYMRNIWPLYSTAPTVLKRIVD